MHNFKTTQVSHYDKEGKPYTTYSAYHRYVIWNLYIVGGIIFVNFFKVNYQ